MSFTCPRGRYSALAANANLCDQSHTVAVKRKVTRKVHGRTEHLTVTTQSSQAGLVMPTEMVAQNGAVIHQSTKIEVAGCAAASAKAARANATGVRANARESKRTGRTRR